jgi:protein-S-isoprenylcysteine O-methyltransferase Ste14
MEIAMITGIPLSVILLAACVAFYAVDFYFMLRYDRQRLKGKGWAWDYTLLTMMIGLAIILQPIFLPNLGWTTGGVTGLAAQVIGIAMSISSIILFGWAKSHLRKFYSERVEIQPDHQIIQTGPYAYVRHPMITSFLGIAFGFLAVNPAWTTLLLTIYVCWDFNRTARQEEELLADNLTGYAIYMRQTPRFVPRLWRKK